MTHDIYLMSCEDANKKVREIAQGATRVSVSRIRYAEESNMYQAPNNGRLVEFSDGKRRGYPNKATLCLIDDSDAYDIAYCKWHVDCIVDSAEAVTQ